MIILRLLRWAAAVVLVVVVAVVAYLSFADLNWLKPRIEAAAADATGRELKIAGRFDLDIVPAPAVLVEDVSLANASWGTEPTMVKVGHLSARIGLWSLLTGLLRVKELRLHDVDVLLEVNDEQEGNWVMGAASPGQPPNPPEHVDEARSGVPVLVEFAELRNIRVRYLAPGQSPFTASLASLDVITDDGSYTVLSAKGQLREIPLGVEGRVGPELALLSGRDITLDLNTVVGEVEASLDGTVGDLVALTGLDLNAVVSSDDVAAVLKRFDVDLPLSGSLRVNTAVNSVEGATRVAVDANAAGISAALTITHTAAAVDFDAAIPALAKAGEALQITLPPGDLSATGRLIFGNDALRLQNIQVRLAETEVDINGQLRRHGPDTAGEFAVMAAGPSLAALSVELPAIPFKASLNASVAPKHVKLDRIETTFGDSDLAGNFDLESGETPGISGKLTSRLLDLTAFAAGKDQSPAGEGSARVDATAPPAEKTPVQESKYVFVDESLPFDILKQANIKIDAEIGRLVVDRFVLLNLASAVDLRDGNLRLRTTFDGPHGGRADNTISLDASGESANLELAVSMRQLRVNLISGDTEDPSLIPPIDISIKLKSAGATPRALAASTSGRILLTAGVGRIESGLLDAVSGDVLAQLLTVLNPFRKTDPYQRLECAVVALNFTDGKGDLPILYVQGEKLKISGGGGVDLNDETLDFAFNTQPREGIGVSADMFVTPFIKLAGTFKSPRVVPAVTGTALAIATGGMSVLAQAAFDRTVGAVDSCAAVLKEASAAK